MKKFQTQVDSSNWYKNPYSLGRNYNTLKSNIENNNISHSQLISLLSKNTDKLSPVDLHDFYDRYGDNRDESIINNFIKKYGPNNYEIWYGNDTALIYNADKKKIVELQMDENKFEEIRNIKNYTEEATIDFCSPFTRKSDLEVLEEQEILHELHISKSDLKDPKILQKVLDKTEKEVKAHNATVDTVSYVLAIAADILVGIVTGSIVAPLVLFAPFIIGATLIGIDFVKDNRNETNKNLDKLVKKAEEVKKNAMKLKDSKHKQEIISNCDKVLKAVNDYKNGTGDYAYTAEPGEEEYNLINTTKDYIKTPWSLGDGFDSDILGCLKLMGYNDTKFLNLIKSKKNSLDKMSITNYDSDIDELGYWKFKDKDVYIILSNDDYWLCYLPLSNKIIELYTGRQGQVVDNYKISSAKVLGADEDALKKALKNKKEK